jgi:hypothetical protein
LREQPKKGPCCTFYLLLRLQQLSGLVTGGTFELLRERRNCGRKFVDLLWSSADKA